MSNTLPKTAAAKPAPPAAVSSARREEQRSWPKRLWYDLLWHVCRISAVALFRIRCFGQEHFPAEGGALVCSNHQSHLDPVLVGLASERRLNYLARESLFRLAPFRWLIQSLDAIPIDRDGFGLSGIKETLRRLKRGEAVLLFPEGTRTPDGEIGPLKPGMCALARRSRAPIVPVGIEGAFDAWPRSHWFPRPRVIHLQFGPPLWPEEVAQLDDQQLLAEISRRMLACHAAARTSRTHGLNGMRFPPSES